jgi:hypothetical protein
MTKLFVTTMPDGSKWGVPVGKIARNRAECYAREFDGDVERSLNEDSLPLFESDPDAIEDWAANNMNWSDVKVDAVMIQAPHVDYQDGWMNGEKEIVDA